MGVKVKFDPFMLQTAITRSGGKLRRNVRKTMTESVQKIAETAKRYAPVDKYNLEDAIKVTEPKQGRDEMGRFGAMTASVYVDMDAPTQDGRTVGVYALIMHEALAPYGSGAFNLGERSQAKDGGSGEVGGKYLERALEEHADSVVEELLDDVQEAFEE